MIPRQRCLALKEVSFCYEPAERNNDRYAADSLDRGLSLKDARFLLRFDYTDSEKGFELRRGTDAGSAFKHIAV